jgi:anhydro-N-acetylmuramic acid kinase
MSGTSADGVDVAIVRIDGAGTDMSAKLISHHHRAYDTQLKQSIFTLRKTGQTALKELAHVGREVSLVYADCISAALNAASLAPTDLAAVAAHGQTLFHDPPNTIQWLDPALIADRTGCTVVSDFRRADCAAGGQGAPLVPFADYVLFRHPRRGRVLLNIGGVANLTYIGAGRGIDELIAFDTGPGNCISDWICRQLEPEGPGYDVNGERAFASLPDADLIAARRALIEHSYFTEPPPKSTDIPTMIQAFGATGMSCDHGSADYERFFGRLLATAASFTVLAIKDAVGRWADDWGELIVSGGGTRNKAIMHLLRNTFGMGKKIMLTDELGVPSESKEAIAFALLAAATLDGLPSNVPSCTGAKRQVILGSITPKPA